MTRLDTNTFFKVAAIFEKLAEIIGGEDSMEIEEESITIGGTFKGYDVVIGSDFNIINVSIENLDDEKMYEDFTYTIEDFKILKMCFELSELIYCWQGLNFWEEIDKY